MTTMQTMQPEHAPEPSEEKFEFVPLVDVADTREAFVFLVDVPGAVRDGVDVTFEDAVLTIAAKVRLRQRAGTIYQWREYGVGAFRRTFSIDTPVNADGVHAELKNGVLRVTLPKAKSAKPRKIDIRST